MFFFHFLNVNICFLVFAERHVLASRLKSITTGKQPARWPCGRQRYPSKRAVQLAVGSEATRWPWGWFLPKTPARSTVSAVHSTASRLPWIPESCTFSLKITSWGDWNVIDQCPVAKGGLKSKQQRELWCQGPFVLLLHAGSQMTIPAQQMPLEEPQEALIRWWKCERNSES